MTPVQLRAQRPAAVPGKLGLNCKGSLVVEAGHKECEGTTQSTASSEYLRSVRKLGEKGLSYANATLCPTRPSEPLICKDKLAEATGKKCPVVLLHPNMLHWRLEAQVGP